MIWAVEEFLLQKHEELCEMSNDTSGSNFTPPVHRWQSNACGSVGFPEEGGGKEVDISFFFNDNWIIFI